MNKVKPTKKLKKTEVKDIIKDTLLALVLYRKRAVVAKKLGLSESGLFWRLREYPEIKEKVKQIPEDAIATLQAGSIKAAEVFVENLDNPDKAMEAAKEVLNRVGIAPKTPPIVAQQNINLFQLIKEQKEKYGI